MTGSSIVTPANKQGMYYSVYCSLSCIGIPEMNLYKVKTALVHHIEDDPVYECKMYATTGRQATHRLLSIPLLYAENILIFPNIEEN